MSVQKSIQISTLLGIAILLPLAGAMASLWQDRPVLLGLYFTIALIVLLVILIKTKLEISEDLLFMVIIASISSFLILSTTLISSNILGWDIHQEYALYQEVSRDSVWHPSVDVPYNSVLSVTILPTMLNAVSGIAGLQIFKLVFPLLFSIVPVILYWAYRKILSPIAAFLSALLYMSYPTFNIELIALARQEIAELLLALTLWIILSTKVQGLRRVVVVLLLTIGIITAHYSLSYIYIYVLLSSLLLSTVFGKTKRLVSFGVMALAASLTVVWYVFLTSGTEFLGLVSFLLFLGQNLSELFNPFTRPPTVLAAVGLGAYPGILHVLNRITYYLVHIVLATGYLLFVWKRHKNTEESKMLSIMTSGLVLLGLVVVLPYFSEALNFARTYHISLLLAAPCFGYGATSLPGFATDAINKMFSYRLPPFRMRTSLKWFLVAGLLLSFFLYSSGWVWAVSLDHPTSFALDTERFLTYPDPALKIEYYGYFTTSQDIAGAQWLRAQPLNQRSLCADFISTTNVMVSYGGIVRTGNYVDFTPNSCNLRLSFDYLSVLNTRYSTWTTSFSANNTFPMSSVNAELVTMNLIYSNGGTTIYN